MLKLPESGEIEIKELFTFLEIFTNFQYTEKLICAFLLNMFFEEGFVNSTVLQCIWENYFTLSLLINRIKISLAKRLLCIMPVENWSIKKLISLIFWDMLCL